MAHISFETPNAKYILLLSAHCQTTEESPSNFDAIILESGSLAPEEVAKSIQYTKLINQAVKNNSQIWLTDADLSKLAYARTLLGAVATAGSAAEGVVLLQNSLSKDKMSRRKFLMGIGLLLPYFALQSSIFHNLHKGEIKHEKFWDANAEITAPLLGKGIAVIRNLLTAEKCESFIAPSLRQTLGKKPTIAMVWGSAHFGIMGLLKNPKRRQTLLKKYDLSKYLSGDYRASQRLILDAKGQIKKVQTFKDTLKQKEQEAIKTQQEAQLSRRRFLSGKFKRV